MTLQVASKLRKESQVEMSRSDRKLWRNCEVMDQGQIFVELNEGQRSQISCVALSSEAK